jgi:hypothetical protein
MRAHREARDRHPLSAFEEAEDRLQLVISLQRDEMLWRQEVDLVKLEVASGRADDEAGGINQQDLRARGRGPLGKPFKAGGQWQHLSRWGDSANEA